MTALHTCCRLVTTTNNSDCCPGDDRPHTTLRDFTRYIEALEPSDVTPTDRVQLRALLDDLKILRHCDSA